MDPELNVIKQPDKKRESAAINFRQHDGTTNYFERYF
jgi:hypothetical protein